MADPDLLASYREKRNFAITPEPQHETNKSQKASLQGLKFVVQKHWARSPHYDFRLEFEGTLKSWAVPKGPSLDPHVKRMAIQVEDHPLSYGAFEGEIPAKQYGAGRVIVWDSGIWLPATDAAQGLENGKLKFELNGQKLLGCWTLIRVRSDGDKQTAWLLIKEHDPFEKSSAKYDITTPLPDSVNSIAAKPKPAVKQAVKRALSTVANFRKAQRKAANNSLPDGSVKAVLPSSLAPQLATLVDSAPAHGSWIYELKFDGYRLLARLENSSVKYLTRTGQD